MQAHTDTDTDMHTHRRSQTDRQTDRQTHTHISNHLPEPSPSVEVSQYRAVCVRRQILHEGESKRRHEIKAVRNNCIPTRSYQCSKQHPCTSIYVPTYSIPKIKTQIPTSYNGRHTDIILSVCMVSTLPQSKLPNLTHTRL